MFKWKGRKYVNARKKVFKDLDTGKIYNFELQDDPNNVIEDSDTPLSPHCLNMAQDELTDDMSKVYVGMNITANTVAGIGRINKVYGFCKQKTRSGKNIFDLQKWYEKSGAVNCTKELISNGVKINFTAGVDAFVGNVVTTIGSTLNETLRPALIEIKASTQYTMSLSSSPKCYIAEYDKDYKLIILMQLPNTYSKSQYTFTTHSNGKYIAVRLGINNSDYTTYNFTGVQIEEGKVATEYEAYGVSPSLKFPAKIHCLGDDVNLLNGVFRQGNASSLTQANRVSCYQEQKLKVKEIYTFSTDLDLSIYDWAVALKDTTEVTGTLQYDSGWLKANSHTVTPEGDYYFGIAVRRKDNANLTPNDIAKFKFKVQKGTVATSWSPYGYGTIETISKKGINTSSNVVYVDKPLLRYWKCKR